MCQWNTPPLDFIVGKYSPPLKPHLIFLMKLQYILIIDQLHLMKVTHQFSEIPDEGELQGHVK